VCMPPANATPLCALGSCDFACVLPFIECGGACTDTKTDPSNCGQCAKVCPSKPHATASCANSQCASQCDSGYSQCTGNCVDTSSDKNNCGACGNKCPGMKTCRAGRCKAPD
jgi:hypothetical protein